MKTKQKLKISVLILPSLILCSCAGSNTRGWLESTPKVYKQNKVNGLLHTALTPFALPIVALQDIGGSNVAKSVGGAVGDTLKDPNTMAALQTASNNHANSLTSEAGTVITGGSSSNDYAINSSTANLPNLVDAEGLRSVSDGGQQYKRYADLMYRKYQQTGNSQFYNLHKETVIRFKSMIKR